MMCSNHREHHTSQNPQEINKDNHSRSVAYRIAEFGLYTIFVLGDVHAFWGDHRILALVVAVIGLGFLLIIDKGFSPKTITRTLIGASILAIAMYFIVPKEVRPEIEVSGSLIPGSEPTPRNAGDRSPFPADAMRILIGDNAGVRTKPGKFTAVQIGNCPVLSMERTADKISVSVDLYDDNGKLIATTKTGEIHAITGENVRLRRGGDLSTLFIEDGAGKELLYVRYLNPTTVAARGFLAVRAIGLLRCRTTAKFQVRPSAKTAPLTSPLL
jgi:hypothetical protein